MNWTLGWIGWVKSLDWIELDEMAWIRSEEEVGKDSKLVNTSMICREGCEIGIRGGTGTRWDELEDDLEWWRDELDLEFIIKDRSLNNRFLNIKKNSSVFLGWWKAKESV